MPLPEQPFLTLAAPAEAETRVKASTFVALAAPARSEEEARGVLAARERRFFDATHNCSAWRLAAGAWRANDAGEPSGSAGAPMLAAIDGAGLLDCVVVVTRYYGGTKLGVGGLVRAYGEAAALALAGAPRLRATPAVRLRVRYGYEHTSVVMRALERVGAAEVEHGFAEGGARGQVELSVAVAAEPDLHEMLREHSAGALAATRLGERLLYAPA